MFELPAIPSWDALHPGISHFPIVLLLVPPLLIIVGLVSPSQRASLITLAFWFLVAGTVSVYLSAASGDAARDLAPKTPEIAKAIETHEEMGSAVRAVFTALTVLLAALRFGPGVLKKQPGSGQFMATAVVFLVIYAGAALLLYNAGHSGALLVHKLGVHARMP